MNKKYIDAKDKFVAARFVYGKAADHKLYTDEDMTVLAKEADVVDAFLCGKLVVVAGTAFVRPVQVDGNEVDVNGTTYEAEPEA